MQRADWLIAGFSAAASVGVTCLLAYCLTTFDLSTDRLPFGLAVGQVGSFMGYLLDGTTVLQLCLFGVLVWRMMKKKVDNGWVWSICLAGASIMQLYVEHLRRMDLSVSSIGFADPGGIAAVAAIIGLAGIVLSLILSKVRAKMS